MTTNDISREMAHEHRDESALPVVSIAIHAHWDCPSCEHENIVPLKDGFQIVVRCDECGRRAKTISDALQ